MISMFADDLANSYIAFHCDNEAIVQIINKQSSRDVQVMKLLRPMILLMLKYQIDFAHMALGIQGYVKPSSRNC